MATATWSNEPTSAVTGTLTLRVTFDEAISGFAAGDLRLRRTSDSRSYTPLVAQTTLTHLGSNVWEVKIADLVSLLGEQNGSFQVRLRRRAVFYETSRQNGPAVAVDSVSFTIRITAPFGVISAFAHQRVTLGTEMALDINITGNPDYAYIEGLLEGFYTNWNNPTLEVRGAATRLITNVPFTVKALKGAEAPLTRAGLFSVVPAAPVITDPGRQTFVRGIENVFNVNISNSPSKARAVGPWVGMKYESHPGGIRIFGIVPDVSHAVPRAEQNIRVTAASGALTDEVKIDFELKTPFFYSAANRDDIYQLTLNNSDQSVSSDLDFDTNLSQIRYLASDSDYLYYGSIATRTRVYRVPLSTGNGRSVEGTQIGGSYSIGGGIVIDGNDAYRAEEISAGIQIRVFNKSTGVTGRAFRINLYRWARGLAIDGDDLIVLIIRTGVSGQHLRWYDKNTPNGRVANHTREVRLPSTSRAYTDITVFDNKVFVTNYQSKTITAIDIETGKVAATYNLPSSLPGMYAITMQAI